MSTAEWREIIRRLRAAFPVEGHVTVRRRPAKRNDGVTTFDGRGDYCIRVNSTQDRSGQIDTLLHEWAHVRAIERSYSHDSNWGALYAEIHESWTRDFKTP